MNVSKHENVTNETSVALVTVYPGMLTVVGSLAVTARVDLGWTYIFDPNVAGSIEISGTGLGWQKDRLLIADCSATCGSSFFFRVAPHANIIKSCRGFTRKAGMGDTNVRSVLRVSFARGTRRL